MYFMQNRTSARAITYCSMAGRTFLGKGDWELWARFSHSPQGDLSTEILGKMEKAQFLLFSGLVFNCSCLSDRTVV